MTSHRCFLPGAGRPENVEATITPQLSNHFRANRYDRQNLLSLNFSNLYFQSMDMQQFYFTWKLQPRVSPWNEDLINNRKVENKFAKNDRQFCFFGSCSTNLRTDSSRQIVWHQHCAYHHTWKSHKSYQNGQLWSCFWTPHLWAFFGLYCFTTSLHLVFTGIICLSMEWQCSDSILMQLLLISSSNGLILNSLLITFSGLLLVVLSVMWRNLGNVSYLSKSLQLQYVHSGILETNTSCIFNIAIVIYTPKKTSISF